MTMLYMANNDSGIWGNGLTVKDATSRFPGCMDTYYRVECCGASVGQVVVTFEDGSEEIMYVGTIEELTAYGMGWIFS